jgi:hypothetical protein
MIRWMAVLVVVAFTAAPTAAADPNDLVPGCEGQVAAPGECTPEPEEAAGGGGLDALPGIPGAFPGANPNIPPVVLPKNFPVVIGLGVTPFNIPSNLPLGPTPPSSLFPGG